MKNSILTGDNPFYLGKEVEQIAELDKKTLQSYHKKAVDDAIKTGIGKTVKNKDGHSSYQKPSPEDVAHSQKRITGAAKAMNRIVKKTNEEISEERPTDGEVANAGRPQRANTKVNKSAALLAKASSQAKPKSQVSVKKAPWDESISQEHLDMFDKLEELHDQLLDIEEALEESGFDLDAILEEEIEEGFEGSSKVKRLIAQRKAAMRRRLKGLGNKPKK